MHNVINPQKPFSTNIYSKRSQLVNHIQLLRDILQNQKFTNEIRYHNQDLIHSIKHFKNVLKHHNKEILKFETLGFPFGL